MDSQTELALQTAILPQDEQNLINPTDIQLVYKSSVNATVQTYNFSIWETLLEIVVSALRVSTMPLSQITDDNPTCYFIVQNCLNSVLLALQNSTNAIIN